jgi:predicted RNA-binding protein with PIN domain
MRWLVDGNNTIGARPDGWWRDRTGAMARLVAGLDAFARATGEEVAVVFDGRERDVGQAGAAGVAVAFAPGARNAADDAIAARVAADADPATLTVVTSDRELARRVRAAGAQVTGAGGFRDRLPEP